MRRGGNGDAEDNGATDAEEAEGAIELGQDRYATCPPPSSSCSPISEKGFGKRTSSYEYRTTGRGGKGIVAMAITEKNGKLVASFPVEESDQIMLVTDGGQLIRCPVDGIRIAGRSTQGVIVFNTAEGEKVASVERLSEDGGEGEENGNGNGTGSNASAVAGGGTGAGEMVEAPVDFRLLAGAGVPARDYKAGDVIFREGDAAQELFIVQSGEVEIRLGNRVLEKLPQFSIFGEMALIDAAPRSATAVAATRRQTRAGHRKAVPVPDQQHAAFRAQRHARDGAAAAGDEQEPVAGRSLARPSLPIASVCDSEPWRRSSYRDSPGAMSCDELGLVRRIPAS